MHDTQSINKQRIDLDALDEIWVFGYGSLIYKVDFPYLERQTATINDFERRFWMGSHDHRGTPEKPGRVLTLHPVKGAVCFGMAYKITHNEFEHLDHREKNGYLRELIDMTLEDGRIVTGVVYIGFPDSPAYFGPLAIPALSQHIYESNGPSGENRDYVFDLAEALRKYNTVDEHVFAIEECLFDLQQRSSQDNKV
ncbi:MAG: gamma-glutamylcyclotransferase [Pseudomonadota bacterium]